MKPAYIASLASVLGLVLASPAAADDWFNVNGWGTTVLWACGDSRDRARELCEDSGDAAVEIDLSWNCTSHCEGGIGDYKCESRARCDDSRPARKTDRSLKTTGSARLPLDLNPCNAAKRDAKKDLREQCEALDGYLEDIEAGSCTCRPLTFRATGEPAAECDVEVSAVCNRTE